MKKSRINYIDGGKMQYVTMKYLEVSMCRSLIFSPENSTLDEYGFVCGEHYIKCDFANDLEINCKEWNFHFQNIILNAFKLVNERHSTKIRVNQFLYMIDQIKNSNVYQNFSFQGGFLHRNNIIIDKNFD